MPTIGSFIGIPKRLLSHLVLSGALLYSLGVPAYALGADNSQLVYFGTYTGQKSKGIYLARLDATKGELGAPELVAETPNPTFLALHPSGRFLYAANEVGHFQGQAQGGVSAFALDAHTGRLTLLNQQLSGGSGPCHVSVDRSGRCLLVANYGSGSVAALPIEKDGRLRPACATIQHQGSSVDPQRQTGPHAHFIVPDPADRFALACDLGLDKVLVYHLDPAKASLVPNVPPSASVHPGAGPRHLAFGAKARFAYVVDEMASDLTVFAYDAAGGKLSEVQTISTLPEGFKGNNSGAEVQIAHSGKFLYASNRGDNSIAIFAIDQASGKVSLQGHASTQGKTPRHFGFDLTGRWLIAENQDSDNVVLFGADARTGQLSPTGQSLTVGAPVCAVFLRAR